MRERKGIRSHQSAAAGKFTGGDIPALYYEGTPDGDDTSLLALIGRWLDTQPRETLIDLAVFIIASESMEICQ